MALASIGIELPGHHLAHSGTLENRLLGDPRLQIFSAATTLENPRAGLGDYWLSFLAASLDAEGDHGAAEAVWTHSDRPSLIAKGVIFRMESALAEEGAHLSARLARHQLAGYMEHLTAAMQHLAIVGRSSDAEAIAKSVDIDLWRAAALGAVAETLGKRGEKDKARELAYLSFESWTSASGSSHSERLVSGVQVVRALRWGGQLATARDLARELRELTAKSSERYTSGWTRFRDPSDPLSVNGLPHVIQALTAAKLKSETTEVVRSTSPCPLGVLSIVCLIDTWMHPSPRLRVLESARKSEQIRHGERRAPRVSGREADHLGEGGLEQLLLDELMFTLESSGLSVATERAEEAMGGGLTWLLRDPRGAILSSLALASDTLSSGLISLANSVNHYRLGSQIRWMQESDEPVWYWDIERLALAATRTSDPERAEYIEHLVSLVDTQEHELRPSTRALVAMAHASSAPGRALSSLDEAEDHVRGATYRRDYAASLLHLAVGNSYVGNHDKSTALFVEAVEIATERARLQLPSFYSALASHTSLPHPLVDRASEALRDLHALYGSCGGWEVSTSGLPTARLCTHTESWFSSPIEFLPGSDKLLIARENHLEAWSLRGLARIEVHNLPGVDYEPMRLLMSSDGSTVATGASYMSAPWAVVDVGTGGAVSVVERSDWARVVAIQADGRRLAIDNSIGLVLIDVDVLLETDGSVQEATIGSWFLDTPRDVTFTESGNLLAREGGSHWYLLEVGNPVPILFESGPASDERAVDQHAEPSGAEEEWEKVRWGTEESGRWVVERRDALHVMSGDTEVAHVPTTVVNPAGESIPSGFWFSGGSDHLLVGSDHEPPLLINWISGQVFSLGEFLEDGSFVHAAFSEQDEYLALSSILEKRLYDLRQGADREDSLIETL